MERDYSPIDHCKECGMVTRMLVFERGVDEVGDEYKALRAEQVPHDRRSCQAFQHLEKEQWPRLF